MQVSMTKQPRTHNPAWKDTTRNQRQAKRRENEKQWLKAHGFTSWEALHTQLVKGEIILQKADKS